MIQTQPLAIEDFSLGVTDFFIDGDPREAKTLDNLFVTTNKKIKTRYGSEVVNDQLPVETRINKIAKLGNDNVFFFEGARAYWDNAGTWTEIDGPASDDFIFGGAGSPIITDTEWRNHVIFSTEDYTSVQKLFINGSGDYVVVNAGLPDFPAGASVANPTGTGQSYLYAFILRYDYTNQDLDYSTLGPVYLYPTAVVGGTIAGGNPAVVTLPTTLAANENYDTANLDVEIYRTSSNGSSFYKVTTVSLGTASYNDVTTDAVLITNEPLYTTGSVVSYGSPPKAKYVHAVNDFGYYANVTEGSNIDPTKVLQSAPGIVDAVPETFFANTEQSITGLSSIYDRPLVFCTDYVYRIDNFFDSEGNGAMQLRRIDDTAGCVSQLSIVRTSLGIFWAGTGGFYWSDGLNVKLITPHLPDTYRTITANEELQKKIVGTYDKNEQRVYWTVCLTETSDPDTLFVLHLKFSDISNGMHACFSTWSGGASFRPTAILQAGDNLYRGDTRGYILRHNSTLTTDVSIDTAAASADWFTKTIIYDYESCFLDFGSKFFRKFVPRILISAGNTTNLSLAISSSNDNDRVMGDLKPIRSSSNITWGDIFPIWGDATAIWNTQGLTEEWRRFPSGGLRCNYKQIRLTNALTQIVTSTLLGTGTVDTTTKILTLTAVPANLEEYYLAFENDGYVREFLITGSTGTTLTYLDPTNIGPSLDGATEYVIRGYPKGQVLELNGFVLHWAFISKSHTPYSASSLGSNPT